MLCRASQPPQVLCRSGFTFGTQTRGKREWYVGGTESLSAFLQGHIDWGEQQCCLTCRPPKSRTLLDPKTSYWQSDKNAIPPCSTTERQRERDQLAYLHLQDDRHPAHRQPSGFGVLPPRRRLRGPPSSRSASDGFRRTGLTDEPLDPAHSAPRMQTCCNEWNNHTTTPVHFAPDCYSWCPIAIPTNLPPEFEPVEWSWLSFLLCLGDDGTGNTHNDIAGYRAQCGNATYTFSDTSSLTANGSTGAAAAPTITLTAAAASGRRGCGAGAKAVLLALVGLQVVLSGFV